MIGLGHCWRQGSIESSFAAYFRHGVRTEGKIPSQFGQNIHIIPPSRRSNRCESETVILSNIGLGHSRDTDTRPGRFLRFFAPKRCTMPNPRAVRKIGMGVTCVQILLRKPSFPIRRRRPMRILSMVNKIRCAGDRGQGPSLASTKYPY